MFLAGLGRVWRLIMLTRSTMTRLFAGRIFRILPWRPRSLPAMMMTVSFFRNLAFFITALPEQAT